VPRSFIDSEPKIINHVISGEKLADNTVEVASGNQKKLNELARLMPGFNVIGQDLHVKEIQSLDPAEVAEEKAKSAWEANDFNPILIEDTSFEIAGLDGRPGPFANQFTSNPTLRRDICETWLNGKDRRALARVIIAIYDGTQARLYEGVTTGKIADSPRGFLDFGWDDIFIPDGQPKGQEKTFAEMSGVEKDKYSMRRKALEAFIKAQHNGLNTRMPVLEIPEPFRSELKRVDATKLQNIKARKFAYTLEATFGNRPSKDFSAKTFLPLTEESNPYFLRYSQNTKSPSIGLVLTDVDRDSTLRYKNGKPILWQMGADRRSLALAQRAEYFIKSTDPVLIKTIQLMEKEITHYPQRANRGSMAIETLLHGFSQNHSPIYARAIKELGYKKVTSDKRVSRSDISQYGLITKIGKYPRSVLGIGSMPAVSGWKDVVTTAVIGHMPVFIPRNNVFADDGGRQIKLTNAAKEDLVNLGLTKTQLDFAFRNIGAAIGTNDPVKEVEKAKKLFKQAGIRLFRIYTINGDPRCVETAALLRKEFGNKVEIFAGQVTDKKQALKYVEQARVDALIFGHGGGRQCTSAINGMAISTVEEIYSIARDDRFNDVSLIVEGGVGTNVGPLFIMGIDGILYSQQLTRGTIETGGIYLQNKEGEFVQPYHGSASAPTMIIEAAYENLREARLNWSGRTKVPEGKPGFMKFSAKANSMTFWIDEFKYHIARTMADLGVENIKELREFLRQNDTDLLRIVSTEAARTATAYGANQ
jgi:XTP/dITP diphosphohydrolase